MPRLRALATIALCALAPASAIAGQLPDLAALAAGEAPGAPRLAGLSVAIADARGVRGAAWGAAVLAPGGQALAPMRPDSPARVASVSKLVTALAALRLSETGAVDLDRDVRAYGVALANPLSAGGAVTLRMLLGHRSGLEDGAFVTVPLGRPWTDALGDGGARWAAPAGLRFAYANVNYGLAATVLEAATGERFDALAQRLVLAPLRLDAGFNWQGMSPAAVRRGAALYRHARGSWAAQLDAPGARPANACPAIVAAPGAACDLAGYRPGANGFLFSPQGGLRASAPDLAVIGAALLRPRPPAAAPSRRALLTAPSLAALFAAVPTHAGAPPGETAGGLMRAWGAGAQCLTGDPADTPVPAARGWCGHMGEAYGLHAGLWVDRAGGRAVAYIVTGAATDPHPRPGGSRFTPFEDAIFAALARP